MQSLKDMDNVLDFRAEEALAALFQPDTVAPVEYLKFMQRKPGLEREKKLTRRRASGYSPSRIFVTSYDLILSTLGKD